MRLRPWILVPFMPALLSAQDLPQKAPGDSLDFEPKLMLDGPNAAPISSPTPSPEDRVQQSEAKLLRAQQRAADSEQLFKEGILAKVEVEALFLRIVQARKELADARLALAVSDADAAKKSFDAHSISKPVLDSANAAVAATQSEAGAAAADWDSAQLRAATVDLQRKRKLYSEGVGSEQEVQKAEDRVVLLGGTGG